MRVPQRLNRESRVNREWSRRCDPALFVLNERGTLSVSICHCFDRSGWEGCWKSGEARRPARTDRYSSALGQS